MKGYFLCFFILFSFSSFCQHTISLSGKLKMKAGTTLRIWRYRDNISFERQILSTTKSKTDSSFSVSLPLSKTQTLTISANEFGAEILFIPDQNYTINLAPFSNQSQKSFQLSSPDQSLKPQNELIKAYETISDSTISLLFGRTNQRPTPNNINQFNSAIDKGLSTTENTYCKELIQSLRIHFLILSRAKSFQTALNTYFHCDQLPFDNPAFQSLVSENFQSYFKSGPPAITRFNLFSGIPDSLHFDNLLTMLSEDPALACLSVREMALLYNIFSMMKEGELEPVQGNNLLKEGTEKSSNPFNRQLALNLAHSLQTKKSGAALPDFSLITSDGNTKSISDFKGKPLHITFFSFKGMADRNLLNQLTDVAHFADSLGVAKFICITTDENREVINKFWDAKKYPMQLYFAPDDYAFIDYFNITSFPFFLLLDAEGMLNSIAPNFPGELLLKQIISLRPAANRQQVSQPTDQKPVPSFLQELPAKK